MKTKLWRNLTDLKLTVQFVVHSGLSTCPVITKENKLQLHTRVENLVFRAQERDR
uniref:Uncharacterized protein n=1 Tax=Arion vulgaris TaxID=1028688 RepID=A0A0B7ALV6_9EUPU